MLSIQEARERMLSHFQASAAETLPLAACANRVLAVDVLASHDLPPFDNSSMDGFALRSADSDLPSLAVVADIPAGTAPRVILGPGQAARIMTGAQVPQGADAVIPVEDTDFQARAAGSPPPATIRLNRPVQPGENIRKRSIDLKTGDPVLQRGRLLKPQDLGLMAMLGIAQVPVHRRPRIAILSSGDELLDVNSPLTDGKVYESNSYVLSALVQSAGGEVIPLGVARDTSRAVEALLQQALQMNADLILTSAGVSVGAFDFVKEVIESDGTLDFWRVNMRPGKPVAFGKYRGRPFIGLPGNPVSAFVGAEVFVRPVLEKMSGLAPQARRAVRVRCAQEIQSDGRESYLRVRLQEEDGVLYAQLTGHQGSGNLLSLVQADALLIVPAGVKCLPIGREAEAILL